MKEMNVEEALTVIRDSMFSNMFISTSEKFEAYDIIKKALEDQKNDDDQQSCNHCSESCT